MPKPAKRSPERKLQVVLSVLRGEVSVAEAARIVDAEDDREHEQLLHKLDEQRAENDEIKAQLRELSEQIKRL